MSKWKYVCETGLALGSSGGGTTDVFVDIHNGNDANSGDFDNPYKTIQQGVLNVNANGRVHIASGVYTEGDFTGSGSITFICYGTVVFDGTAFTSFNPNGGTGTFYMNAFYPDTQYNYGKAIIINYTVFSVIGVILRNTELINVGLFSTSFLYRMSNVKFNNTITDLTANEPATFKNISVLNNSVLDIDGIGVCKFLDNESDNTSSVILRQNNWQLVDFNHFRGSIEFNSSPYANGNLWKASMTGVHAQNDLDSSVTYVINNITGDVFEDNTIQDGEDLSFKGSEGTNIGYYGKGVSVNGNTATLVNTTNTSGVITLASSGSGTAEWTDIQFSTVVTEVVDLPLWGDVSLPDGERISTQLASASIPSLLDVELAVDSTTPVSTPYIKVKANTKPTIDAAGKGNADPLFDCLTESPLSGTHYNLKVTLRDNETPI